MKLIALLILTALSLTAVEVCCYEDHDHKSIELTMSVYEGKMYLFNLEHNIYIEMNRW